MTRPTVSIHNTQTNEITVREYNDAEFAAYEANQVAQATAQAEAQVKAQAKAELLERLGITDNEAKLLLT